MKDKGKYTFTVDKKVHAEFMEACHKNGMKMSPRIEVLMRRDINLLNEKVI